MADISKITLPSGTTYDIKDQVARDAIAGGVSFIIAWDGVSTPVPSGIPEGVKVVYNDVEYTGTLSAETSGSGTHAQPGAFYLVKSSTSAGVSDAYDEYVPVGTDGSKTWEKIGDTQIDLSDVVTDVSLSKQTATVIGSSATLTNTQPTVALSTGATAGTGVVSLVTGITGATASGDSVTALTGLGTPSTSNAIGADSTFKITQPTIKMALSDFTTSGKVGVITEVSATTTNIKATASGGAVSASGDSVTALTGLGTPTTQNAVKSVSPTTKKLAVTTVTGVSGSTTASKATAGTSQTTADGTGTASSTNTDWLKGISVANETLTIGAATMDTQTTTQYTFSDVTVPTAASSATTVATGATTTSGSGADVVTDVAVGDTIAAITGYASPITDTVLGTGSTFNVTNPTVALSTGATAGAGVISVATDASGTTKYIGGTASGANTAWDSKDQVAAVTGYASPTTDTVLGTGSTITVTPTTTNVKATASGGGAAWNSKDEKTVLTNATDVNVTKGS